jgi:hypothetical protein
MRDAIDLAQNRKFDWATLDVNLDGQPSYPVLKERGVPFAFAAGYGTNGLDAKYGDAPVLSKSFVMADLENCFQQRSSYPTAIDWHRTGRVEGNAAFTPQK